MMKIVDGRKDISMKEKVVKRLNEKESVLDYLYSLWMDCDIFFIPERAGVLYNEVSHDREVHRNE